MGVGMQSQGRLMMKGSQSGYALTITCVYFQFDVKIFMSVLNLRTQMCAANIRYPNIL